MTTHDILVLSLFFLLGLSGIVFVLASALHALRCGIIWFVRDVRRRARYIDALFATSGPWRPFNDQEWEEHWEEMRKREEELIFDEENNLL